MTALALELCCTLMADRSSPVVGLAVRNKVLPQALTLIKSSLLQGQALLVLLFCLIGVNLDIETFHMFEKILCWICRHCKTSLLPWFILQTQVLMSY